MGEGRRPPSVDQRRKESHRREENTKRQSNPEKCVNFWMLNVTKQIHEKAKSWAGRWRGGKE